MPMIEVFGGDHLGGLDLLVLRGFDGDSSQEDRFAPRP